jgi:hypothetical protein
MSLASSLHTGIFLSAVVAIVGCSSTAPATNGFKSNNGYSNPDATTGDDGGGSSSSGGGGGYNSSSSGAGTTSSSTSGGGGACPSSCTADRDCQNSCPAAPSGSNNCCDTTSGTCFVTAMAACPTQPIGAAE